MNISTQEMAKLCIGDFNTKIFALKNPQNRYFCIKIAKIAIFTLKHCYFCRNEMKIKS
jgi:hypothetical protein